jgi:eukaryotic-like serine/threonine-protein kinase
VKEGRKDKEATVVQLGAHAEVSQPGQRLTDTLLSPARRRPTDPDLPFDQLGSYRLVQWLGGGGMGQVFLAEHRQLGRKVALKVLRKELAHTPEVVRRFVHEAQLVNQIKNEHIVDIHDFGEGPDGLEYFVMELLVGRDLARAREEDGPFSLASALDVVRQVGSALEAVHSHKIIHRDLKPENIFLAEKNGRKDFVKLLDFGLAKLTETAPGATDGTAIGTLLGTPLYMSPEQAMGLRVDWRTDIFSLGLVLYWMLFDRLPHEGDDLEVIRQKRMEQPVSSLPPQTARGEPVPPAVAAALVGCLVRNPSERIQTVTELVAKLPSPGALKPPAAVERSPLRRSILAGAVGMALAAAALAAYFGLRQAPVDVTEAAPTSAEDTLPPLPSPAPTQAAVPGPASPPIAKEPAPAETSLAPPAPTAPAAAKGATSVAAARSEAPKATPTHADPSGARRHLHPARHKPDEPDEGSPDQLIDPFPH